MAAVTTYSRPKPFAWSYSKLKNFESCPKRHWHIDIQKDVKEEESEQLKWGNRLHDAMAKRIDKGVRLPEGMGQFEPICARIVNGPGTNYVEQKLAITAEFGPCSFFDRAAWFRGIGDVIKVQGPVAMVIDWKTGKIVEDSVQLALMAQCIFAHYPEVKRVRSIFFWLKDDATTEQDFSREDMPGLWASLWPRIEQMKQAAATTSYPAKPGRLCRSWCPVKVCPHHGT
jgi:hypothetical protein